ncbi:hypothetical protein FTX61_19640 [Nitriliruptoraceae bacterium ZYF776]|nr:hypothetical protein [Profundirhabdus halotolerans]
MRSRRRSAAALLGVGILLVACAAPDAPTPGQPLTGENIPADDGEARHGADEPVPDLPPAPEPPQIASLSDTEVYPNAKWMAAGIARAVTTYDPGQERRTTMAEVVPAEHVSALLDSAAELHHPDGWSRGRVIYPQLGGVTDERVSVMVVTEQRIGTPEGARTETRTLDVRLRLEEGEWVFDRLASVGGEAPVPPPPPSPEARAVLEDPRIELPDSARWDILAGEVSSTLLRLMARAADQAPYGVVVLSAGHPYEIFGTDRQSDHTRGQAVDIYRIDDDQVIDDRYEASTTHEFTQWLYAQPEVARIGSPWALDGFGGRSFTDVVHQDHLHVAVAE